MRPPYDSSAPAAKEAGAAWNGRNPAIPLGKNAHLLKWVEKMARLTHPAAVHWVDGSREEYDALCAQMVEGGTFIKLNEELWPGCYLARSDPSDVARVENGTFICNKSDGGLDVRDGGHNWDCWKASLPEALRFRDAGDALSGTWRPAVAGRQNHRDAKPT